MYLIVLTAGNLRPSKPLRHKALEIPHTAIADQRAPEVCESRILLRKQGCSASLAVISPESAQRSKRTRYILRLRIDAVAPFTKQKSPSPNVAGEGPVNEGEAAISFPPPSRSLPPSRCPS